MDYALGYHERWLVYLHRLRWEAVRTGKELTREEEDNALSRFMEQNRKTYSQPTLCELCNEEIAEALLKGEDPFAMPAFFRQALEDFNLKFGKPVRRQINFRRNK